MSVSMLLFFEYSVCNFIVNEFFSQEKNHDSQLIKSKQRDIWKVLLGCVTTMFNVKENVPVLKPQDFCSYPFGKIFFSDFSKAMTYFFGVCIFFHCNG